MVTGGADAVGAAVVVFCGRYFGVAVVFSFVAVVVAVLIGVAFLYMQAVVRVSVLYDHSAHVVIPSGRIGAAELATFSSIKVKSYIIRYSLNVFQLHP